ncbi:hypothetical protein CQ054_21255 [Ochrobactrum sp. MYb29]|nr:hypothetical protein CQ054_21255 [Ochrobactrum sp. MYb29]
MQEDKIVAARLSAEVNETIFRNLVVRRELPRNAEPLEKPVIILVGGQPGAGKTSLVTSGVSDLSHRGATVQIVGDNLRSYHPRYDAFQKNDPTLQSQLTHHDVGRWTDKLIIEAASCRLNIVVETTMRSPEAVAFIAQQARVAGYRVETRIVAVNERESWQGCLNRFEQMHSEGNAACIPPKEHHDNAVIGLVDTIRHLEDKKLVDVVQVRLRNGDIIFDNQLVDGVWLKPVGAAAALVEERNRIRTPEELELFSTRWQAVLQSMESRNADAKALEFARATAHEDMAHFRSQMGEGKKQDNVDSDPPHVLIPAAFLPDLTPAEISERVQASDFVQRKKVEVEQLSSIVFGSSAPISDALSRIDSNPALASGFAGDLKSEPLQFGDLAGEPGGWIRRASPERQNAEVNLPRLATAIEDYGDAVRYQQLRIVQEHRAEQRRVSQEVPMPSADLLKVLRSIPEAQEQRFSERPDLHKELTQLSVAFDKRLAPHEHKAFYVGDLASAQRSLGVSATQVSQIAQAKQQFKESRQIVRNQSLTQRQGPVITR